MTLQPQNDFSIPEETVRVARAAFPNGNLRKAQHVTSKCHLWSTRMRSISAVDLPDPAPAITLVDTADERITLH